MDNKQEMTKGQERRLAKKKEAERAKRAALSSKIIGTAVSVLILAAIVFGIAYGIFSGVKAHIAEKERLARLIPVVDDYGTGLNADGTVAGINPDDYISLTFDPNEKITIPYADIEFSDEDVEDAIDKLLNDNTDEDGKIPEFTDEFVKDVLKQDLTAEEYKAQLKSDNEAQSKEQWINDYMSYSFDAIDKPDDYIRTYAGILKSIDLKQLENYNMFYQAYTGSIAYADVYEMREKTEDEYEELMINEATKEVLEILAYQKVYDVMGLSYTQDEYKDYLAENEISNVYDYGEGYVMMNFKREIVQKALLENAYIDMTVEETVEEENETEEIEE